MGSSGLCDVWTVLLLREETRTRDKKGYTPPPKKKSIDRRGTLLFASGEVLDVQVVTNISSRPSTICALLLYTSLYILATNISEQPNDLVQALSSPNIHRPWYLVRAGYISAHCERVIYICLLYTSPSPRDLSTSRMPSSA